MLVLLILVLFGNVKLERIWGQLALLAPFSVAEAKNPQFGTESNGAGSSLDYLKRKGYFLYSASTRLIISAKPENGLKTRTQGDKGLVLYSDISGYSLVRYFNQVITSGERNSANLKAHLVERTRSLLGADVGSFYSQLVLGKLDGAPSSVQPLFKTTGMQYILVVSGFHLNFLIRATSSFLKGRLSNSAVATATVIVTFLYFFINSFSLSLFRAMVMSLAAIAGRYIFHRQHRARYFLPIFIFSLFLLKREILENISFQLSVVATIGIVYLTPLFLKRDSLLVKIENAELGGDFPGGGYLRKYFVLVRDSFWISVAVNLAIAPLIWHYFADLSLISIVISSVFFWLAPLLVIFAWVVVLASGLTSSTAPLFANVASLFASIASLISSTTSHTTGATPLTADITSRVSLLLLPLRELAFALTSLVRLIFTIFAKTPLVVSQDSFPISWMLIWWTVLLVWVYFSNRRKKLQNRYRRLTL